MQRNVAKNPPPCPQAFLNSASTCSALTSLWKFQRYFSIAAHPPFDPLRQTQTPSITSRLATKTPLTNSMRGCLLVKWAPSQPSRNQLSRSPWRITVTVLPSSSVTRSWPPDSCIRVREWPLFIDARETAASSNVLRSITNSCRLVKNEADFMISAKVGQPGA